MTVHGLVFDLDGVLTDTAEYHYLAWKQLADEEGLDFTREDNDQLRGVSRRESLLRLLKGKTMPEATMQAWMDRKNNYYKAYLENITQDDLLPGVEGFLHAAQSQSLPMAVGSASKNAKTVLNKLQITHFFKVIGDGYAVENSKPAADLFVWAAGGLGLRVRDLIVFEDAPAGIDAAKTAGCATVGIGAADLAHADLVASGFDELTLEQVLNHFAAVH